VVTAHAHRLVHSGRLATVRGWLEAVPDSTIRDHPSLAAVAAWVWGLDGSSARATAALLTAERTGDDRPPEGCVSLGSAALTARAALAPRGVEQMLVDAQEAFELEPAGSPWRPVAAVLLGCARRLNGLDPEAVWPLELAAETGRDVQPWAAQLALAQRALVAADAGDWEVAASCSKAAAAELAAHRPAAENPATVAVHAAAARVAQRRGDDAAARAEVHSAQVHPDRPLPAFPWLNAQNDLVLAQVQLDLGDPDGARLRLDAARRQLVQLPTQGVLRARLEDLATAWARAGTDVRARVRPALSPAERTVLDLLRTHLTLAEIAEELHVSRNTVKSQVASLYRKLDASSRGEALRQARAVGLG
jgi:LuxR family maltose regulon positive regulatory protein